MTQTSATQQAGQPSDKTAIRPFQVNFPKAEIDELRRRINATRWPERETVEDLSQGVQLATMQALARYWAEEYDWRKCEENLQSLPHFITEIDGLDIHFVHVRSQHEDALPQLGGAGISQTHPLQQTRQRWALCRLGTAETLFRRGSHGISITAQIVEAHDNEF